MQAETQTGIKGPICLPAFYGQIGRHPNDSVAWLIDSFNRPPCLAALSLASRARYTACNMK